MKSRRWIWLVVIAAAAVAAFLAPPDWATGDGAIVVERHGVEVERVAVALGSTAEITEGSIEVPRGVPVDDTIEVRVDAAAVGATADPLEQLTVSIELTDGSVEHIPVLRVDDGTAVAIRTAPQHATVVLALLAAVVVLWVTELVPLHVAGLSVPVVLVVFDVTGASAALAPFFSPIIVLFFGGFLLAEAMHRVELDRLAAAYIVSLAGASPLRLYLAFIGVSAAASMWMSNTAAVAVLLPIAMAVTAPVSDDSYRRAVVLGVAYAATVGGVGSAIGTPANQLAVEFLGEVVERDISFVRWFAFGLPAVALLLAPVAMWVWFRFSPQVAAHEVTDLQQAAIAERDAAGRLTGPQVEVLVTFLLILTGWLTQTWHGVHPGIVALAGAIVLMVLGRIETDDLGRISWPSLLTFGGGLAIGTAVATSGTSDWLVTRLDPIARLPDTLAILAVCAVTLALTTVASNTASAATLIPLAIPLAGLIGTDPVQLVILVAIVSSIDFALVIGTPPTMLAYDTGLFTTRRIFSIGIVLDVIGVVLVGTLLGRIWTTFGII